VSVIKDIQLLWVYSSQMEPGFGVKNHSHDYFHLLSIIDGKMNFSFGDDEYTLQKGDIVLVRKGTTHSSGNDTSTAVKYYEVKFTVLTRPISQMLASLEDRIYRDEFAVNLVAYIANEYLHDKTLKDESATAALKTLVYYLTSDARYISKGEPSIIDTTGFSPLAKRVISLMTERYAENLTLDDISEGVGTTKNYLCNAFKRNTGITIIDCLNMIRVRKAAELIVYSDLPLAQVAQMCGYVSASHFNRVFMRYVGIPPGQCRRAYSYDLLLKRNEVQRNTDSFMYSVLAGKSISSDIIDGFEQRKSEKSDMSDQSGEE